MFEKIYKGSIFMENIFDVKCLFNRGQLENGNLIRFLGISKGSAFETEYQLLLAKDLKYINEKDYDELNEKIQKIISMLTNLIKSLRSKRKTNKK